MSEKLSNEITELIARHGLGGYGLYIFIISAGSDFHIDDDFLRRVAMIEREEIIRVVSSCLELGLLMLSEV